MLQLRVVSSLFLIGFALFCVISGGGWHLAMVVGLSMLCVRELLRLFRMKGYAPAFLWVTASIMVLLLTVGIMGPTYLAPLLASSALVILGWLLVRRKPQAGIADVSTSWFAVVYLGFLPSYLILVRNLPEPWGLQFTVLLHTCIWATDTGAYFGGRFFGRHKLLEAVSPKKTIEGSLAGVLCAVGIGAMWSHFFKFPLQHGVALGLLVSVIAQVGDLGESLLKRDAGAKDSGTIIPGHGGILDRLDSYLLTGVVVYYYLRWFHHPWLP